MCHQARTTCFGRRSADTQHRVSNGDRGTRKFLLKLHPEKPSPTIQGQPGPWVGPFHWESRRLRVAELKRLMTFPDEFEVLGSRREQQLQLGNAVPPLLGRRVAEAIAAELASAESKLSVQSLVAA